MTRTLHHHTTGEVRTIPQAIFQHTPPAKIRLHNLPDEYDGKVSALSAWFMLLVLWRGLPSFRQVIALSNDVCWLLCCGFAMGGGLLWTRCGAWFGLRWICLRGEGCVCRCGEIGRVWPSRILLGYISKYKARVVCHCITTSRGVSGFTQYS